jgi:hypothetical protein
MLQIVRLLPTEYTHVNERTTQKNNREFPRGKKSSGNSNKNFAVRGLYPPTFTAFLSQFSFHISVY